MRDRGLRKGSLVRNSPTKYISLYLNELEDQYLLYSELPCNERGWIAKRMPTSKKLDPLRKWFVAARILMDSR